MATTELDVIRKFMKSLDNTKKKGTAALNEAVKSASGGKFPTMQSLINSFASDLSKYGGSSYSTAATSKFLTEYCGIVLSNADTGAITGADAGGTKVKTAASIVPESGTTSDLVYPAGKSSTISGVTVKWPDSSTLSSVKKAIVSRLNTWWLSGALDLIEESFGLSFKESGATVKKIPVNFYYASNGILAYVEHFNNSSTGNATSISLNVNMKYYSNLNLQDVNGKSSNSGSIYLDRLLAHELTHAVMATNIKWFANLPKFVKEGLAELVHGPDDTRTATITRLAQSSNASYVKNTLFNLSSSASSVDVYSGGYMLFRYFAKQVAGEGARRTISGTSGKDVLRGTNNGDLMYGLGGDDVLLAGKGDDTLYGGKGSDSLDGGAGADILYGEAGNDTLRGGAGNDSLNGGADKDWLYGGTGHDTLRGGAGNDYLEGGTGNDRLYGDNGNDLLYGNDGKDTLYGGNGNDTLYGGVGNDSLSAGGSASSRNTLEGGKGNDVLVGGAGIDRFVYTAGDGNDTIKGYESKRDIIDLREVDYTLARQGSSDILLTAGSGSILLKGAYGKVLKINDRNGTTKNVKTTGLGWASSASGSSSSSSKSSTKSSASAYLLEPSVEAYVSEASWSLDSAVDSIRAGKETAALAALSTGTEDSVPGAASLLYADASSSLDGTDKNIKG